MLIINNSQLKGLKMRFLRRRGGFGKPRWWFGSPSTAATKAISDKCVSTPVRSSSQKGFNWRWSDRITSSISLPPCSRFLYLPHIQIYLRIESNAAHKRWVHMAHGGISNMCNPVSWQGDPFMACNSFCATSRFSAADSLEKIIEPNALWLRHL